MMKFSKSVKKQKKGKGGQKLDLINVDKHNIINIVSKLAMYRFTPICHAKMCICG